MFVAKGLWCLAIDRHSEFPFSALSPEQISIGFGIFKIQSTQIENAKCPT